MRSEGEAQKGIFWKGEAGPAGTVGGYARGG
jgi:hypothetical protein